MRAWLYGWKCWCAGATAARADGMEWLLGTAGCNMSLHDSPLHVPQLVACIVGLGANAAGDSCSHSLPPSLPLSLPPFLAHARTHALARFHILCARRVRVLVWCFIWLALCLSRRAPGASHAMSCCHWRRWGAGPGWTCCATCLASSGTVGWGREGA